MDIIRNWGYEPGERVRLRVANPILGRNPDDAIGRNPGASRSKIPSNSITSRDNFTGTVSGPDLNPGGNGYLLIDLDRPVFYMDTGQIIKLQTICESPGNLERYKEVPNETLWRKLAFWK